MARDRAGILGGIVFGAVALLVCGGLLWYGTGYTYQRVREAVAYSRASFCPEEVDADPNCVKIAGAVVADRIRDTTSDTTVYYLDLQAPGRSDRVRVSYDVYDGLRDSDEVTVWRFHGKIVAIEHRDQRWGTRDTPGPPYAAGLVGTLFWAAVFGALAVTVTANKTGSDPTRWDFRLYFGALAVAVGLIIGGFVLDYVADVVEFDPRLVFVSLALTPAVSVAVVVKYAMKRLTGRARP